MGPKRSQYCLYHIPHFMEDHKHCLKPSFVLRLWMVSRRGRGGELCAKVEGFHAVEILWGGMSRALQQWPSLIVTGVTLIISTLREHFTLFQTLSSLIYFSVEVSSSKQKYLCKTVCYSSSVAGLTHLYIYFMKTWRILIYDKKVFKCNFKKILF